MRHVLSSELASLERQSRSWDLQVEMAIGEGIWGAAAVVLVSLPASLGDRTLHTGMYFVDDLLIL